MAKKIDLTGQRFGRWLVLGEAEKKGCKIAWLCRCLCGNEAVVTSGNLKSGISKSCGCLHTQKCRDRREDLVGRRFGRLTVTSYCGEHTRRVSWLCVCDCGKEFIVSSTALKSGNTKSCGCYSRDNAKKRFEKPFKPGEKLNRLTVIAKAGKNKCGKILWRCLCECGRETTVISSALRTGRVRSCGCLNKEMTTKYGSKEERDVEKKLRRSQPAPGNSRWLSRLPSCDGAVVVDGFIHVKCKMCGLLFAPSKNAIGIRLRAYTGRRGGDGNFYCGESCKDACPVFNHKTNRVDPRVTPTKSAKQKARSCRTRSLNQIQCDEKGYNYCERCGDIIDVELHHTILISEDPAEAVNPAGHMLLCAGCHLELHRLCG